MASKAVNFKMDEETIRDVRSVAASFGMTQTEVLREALSEYLARMKADPYYRLTASVREADEAESAEVLSALDKLSDDDLTIVSAKRFTV